MSLLHLWRCHSEKSMLRQVVHQCLAISMRLAPEVVTPDLELVPWEGAWNRIFGLLFIDQPIGTGYSISGQLGLILVAKRDCHLYGTSALPCCNCRRHPYSAASAGATAIDWSGDAFTISPEHVQSALQNACLRLKLNVALLCWPVFHAIGGTAVQQ